MSAAMRKVREDLIKSVRRGLDEPIFKTYISVDVDKVTLEKLLEVLAADATIIEALEAKIKPCPPQES